MRILIIMAGFFPGQKYGGPPVSIDNFCSLMKEHECYIVTRDHDLFEQKRYEDIQEGWNDRSNCKVLYLSNVEYNKTFFESIIQEIRPDILYLQGLFQSCVLPCLQLAKKYRIPILLAPRGELCEGALNVKKLKKMLYIETIILMGLVRNIHWQSTSDEETRAIKRIMKAYDDHIHRLDNIPSIPKKKYPRKEKVAGEGKFVFLSRIHPKKNLLFAISLFREIDGKVQFDIYGPIEDKEYWNLCLDEIKKLPKNVEVKYKGMVVHDEVHEVLSQYDAFLFPTLSENYGHVIAESLMVGTPVIVSNQTPWKNLEEASVGWDISLQNEAEFIKAIQYVIDEKNQVTEQYRNAVAFLENKMKIDELYYNYHSALTEIREDT